MHHITEDTPPDMLAGAMDLSIRLPDGRDVHMSIERSTPMMDLLVQVTTAHKLRPSEHIIQALDMTPPPTGSVDRERVLPYKPNTPIGALDTQCIRVLPKSTRAPAPKPPAPPGHQPFESTFRLQVHLPRNQFCVIRVGKHVLLEEIMRKVCEEKNLDPRKYEFRHPANIDKVLDPKRTLNDYEITEITVAYRGSGSHLTQTLSSSDIMVLQREEERRKMQKTAGGVLNLIFRRGRTSMGSGSVSSDTRSISPTQSDDSRSVTPPAVQPPQLLPPPLQEQKQPPARPKPPQRKRRPAPKPPTQQPQPPPPPAAPQSQPVRESPVIITPPSAGDTAGHQQLEQCQPDGSTKLENGLTICHSRNSSDSSGYHEASILSDNCQTTLPRRPKSTVIHTNNINTNTSGSTLSNSNVDLSKSTGNLSKMTGQSKSTMSLTTAGRKKKAPPPPPVMKTASSAANISTVTSSVPVVASRNRLEPVQKPPPPADVSPSLTNLTVPQPKPRTIKPQAPVPKPRQRKPSVTSQLSEDNTNTQPLSGNEKDIQPVVAELPNSPEKMRRQSKFDTIGRKRGFQIGKSMLSMEEARFVDDNSSLYSRKVSGSSSEKTRTTSSSSSQYFETEDNLDDLDINNIEMFENTNRKRSVKRKSKETFHRIGSNAEIHELPASASYKEVNAELPSKESLLSLRSVDSMPEFLGSAANMTKWDSMQDLDEISFCAEARNRAWLVGDVSDTESTYTPSEVTNLPLASDVPLQTNSLTSNVCPTNLQSVPIVEAPLSRSSSVSEQSYTSTPTIDKNTPELVTSTPKQAKLDQSESRENITLVNETTESSSVKTEKVLTTDEISVCAVEKNVIQKSDLDLKTTKLPVTTNIQELHVKPVLPITVPASVTNVNQDIQPVITRARSIDIQQDISPPLVPQEHIVQVLDPVVPHKQSEIPLKTHAVLPTLNPLTITPKMDKTSYLEDNNELESEWQYTLPSPPTAFRDSSPTNFTDMTNYDTVTFNGLSADSVVTSPALFEKLESIRDTRSASESVLDTRSETDTVVSDGDNLTSQKPQVMTSKYLSLENLEKRKSLVLERELASLKNDENVDTILRNQKNNLISEIEEVIQHKSKSSTLSRNDSQSREKILLAATDSTLPNFKITTYDQPKAKINIFEDDSVRSNVENKSAETSKRNSIVDSTNSHKISEDFTLVKKRNSLVSASTENIHFPKRNSLDRGTDEFVFKKPQEPVRFKSSVMNGSQHDRINEMVARSESFSSQKNGWSRLNPVKRSKSHISLDKYKDDAKVSVAESDDGLHKSNSLFNVSGLQSLEVMRMILPKLGNTPPSSPVDSVVSKDEPLKTPPPKPQPVVEPPKPMVTEPAPVVKKYHYAGPPAINLGTWSDRPKSQVSIKEDRDYKISNIASMKAKFSSQTNLNSNSNISADNLIKSKSPEIPTNFPTVNIRVNSNESKDQPDGKINIKINSEPSRIITNPSSNVIIKIENGAEHSEDTTIMQVRNENKLKDNNFYSRFLNQTTATGYRKPLGNINGVDKVKQRPHSIAFDASCPDLSRVPIVRAVELKKPYKNSQGNKTITQIIHDSADINGIGNTEYTQKITPIKSNTLNNQNRHSSVYLSSENINNNNGSNIIKPSTYFNKPITRGNSFAATRSHNSPVVKGFRTTSAINNTDVESTNNTRASWNQYGTLPAKSTTVAFTNSHNTVRTTSTESVPFSQSMLKKTEHGFIDKAEKRQSLSNGTDAACTPPPPPLMPKITAVTKKPIQQRQRQLEPRDMMLESIRNFGGRAGLKAVK